MHSLNLLRNSLFNSRTTKKLKHRALSYERLETREVMSADIPLMPREAIELESRMVESQVSAAVKLPVDMSASPSIETQISTRDLSSGSDNKLTHLTVQVVNAKSEWLEGAKVILLNRAGKQIQTQYSDRLGYVCFGDLPLSNTEYYYKLIVVSGLFRVVDSAVVIYPNHVGNHVKVTIPAKFGLTPGIYVGARAALWEGSGFSHQFVIAVPEHPENFKNLKYLNNNTRGIILSGFADGLSMDRLVSRVNDPDDLGAIRKFLQPKSFPNAYTLLDLAKVNVQDETIDSRIQSMIILEKGYNKYTSTSPLEYDIPNILGGNGLNSNSWAQSIVEYACGEKRVQEDFPGRDPFRMNRIPIRYFNVSTVIIGSVPSQLRFQSVYVSAQAESIQTSNSPSLLDVTILLGDTILNKREKAREQINE